MILSAQAQFLAQLHGRAPGVTIDLLGLVNRLLPAPGGIEKASRTGEESQAPLTRRLASFQGTGSPQSDQEI